MKKTLLSLLIMAQAPFVFGQAVMGNKSNDAVIFISNNTDRVRIEANGDVGIGSYPSAISDLSIIENAAPTLFMGNNNSGSNLSTGAVPTNLDFGGYAGGSLGTLSRIYTVFQGTGGTRATDLILAVRNTGGLMSPRIIMSNTYTHVRNTGLVVAGGALANTYVPSAQLEVFGAGSSSASNSVSVINSSSANVFNVADDGTTELANTIKTGAPSSAAEPMKFGGVTFGSNGVDRYWEISVNGAVYYIKVENPKP